jgi:membrane protease YdiL (CAAX protease family)
MMVVLKRKNTKRILIFLAIAVGVRWTATLAIFLTGMLDSSLLQAAGMANIIAVSTPLVANIATRLITKEGWGHLRLRPNFRRGWRFYLAVWLLPLLAVAIGVGTYYLLFPQSFDSSFSGVRGLFASAPSLAAANPWALLLIIVVQVLFITVPINGLLSIGEEFGWRAYLLPKLVERFVGRASAAAENPAHANGNYAAGARKASLLIGVVWGVWHWPLFLMSLKVDPSMPILFLPVYVLGACAMSVLLCWVTLRSGSVWPASIGHGAINAFAGLVTYTWLVITNLRCHLSTKSAQVTAFSSCGITASAPFASRPPSYAPGSLKRAMAKTWPAA